MSAEEKDMLQRIVEGMNALPEPEQKYILGFAEGALAAANRPLVKEPEKNSVQEGKNMASDFKVTKDLRVFLGDIEIQNCLGFNLSIEAGECPEVLLRLSCDSVDIDDYSLMRGVHDRRPSD